MSNDLTGKVYGRLTVVGKSKEKYKWDCICVCGGNKTAKKFNLESGFTQSCGCLLKEITASRSTKHGFAKRKGNSDPLQRKLYRTWKDIKNRCYNPKVDSYQFYGAKGVKVYEPWADDFQVFLKEVGFPPSENHTIERIDPNGDYSPGNVRWATWKEQANNKRNTIRVTVNGVSKTVREWSDYTGIPYSALRTRKLRNFSENTFLRPLR